MLLLFDSPAALIERSTHIELPQVSLHLTFGEQAHVRSLSTAIFDAEHIARISDSALAQRLHA